MIGRARNLRFDGELFPKVYGQEYEKVQIL
jgi:hypothetical protein